MKTIEKAGSALTGLGLCALGVATIGVIFIAKKATAGQCYTVDYIGTGPAAPYYYATYLGSTASIMEAFGETNQDIFTVELWDGVYYDSLTTVFDTIERGQKFRFQVIRTTEICNIKLEEN